MLFEIEVYGEKQLSREMLFRAWRAENGRSFFESMRDFLVRVERAQFATEGAYGSGGWEPLALSTIRQKRAKGVADPSRILVESGLLRESLVRKRGRMSKRIITDTQLVFGTHVPYAKYHQSPAPRGPDLPRRPLIDLTQLDKKHIERAASLWVTRGELLL